VAKPSLVDPNFRQTVVLVTQTADASTVGVILNRPTARKHGDDTVYSGGPVMREVLVTLFRAEQPPEAPAFHVLNGVYLSMHPQNVERFAQERRLFAGFSGWAPGQLETEFARDGWFVLPASAEIVFRKDTAGLWDELVRKARGRVAML
jgi:putative transcriptional regulator